jgi:hypothetical protein
VAPGRADSIRGRTCLLDELSMGETQAPGGPEGTPGLAGVPGSPDLFRELAVVSFGQVVSASSIVGKMVKTGPGPVAWKAGNRERT